MGLSGAQRDGRACLRCGREVGAMVPIGVLDGLQLFAHPTVRGHSAECELGDGRFPPLCRCGRPRGAGITDCRSCRDLASHVSAHSAQTAAAGYELHEGDCASCDAWLARVRERGEGK